jgi:alkylhydroperoxidase/carboxymuconolactone decarboxylase family protein YurZ
VDATDYRDTLLRLALSDERFMETELGMGRDTVDISRLDPKTHSLVRLGATLAIDAAPSAYQSAVEPALAAGASIDEIVGTLIAVAPTIGLARVVSAAPELALALGYDVDAAIESREGDAW